MAQPITRPDTPLAATPEPQPVSSGLQPAANMAAAQPVNKYQATADTAIQQIQQMIPAAPSDNSQQK
jgi:hypothetical protein